MMRAMTRLPVRTTRSLRVARDPSDHAAFSKD
jgi:hypothetical protein